MSKFISATVKDVRRETPDAVSFSIEVPEDVRKEFTFIQGQYLTFRTIIDGEDVRRSYSICSSPLDMELRVAVKEVEGGKFSSFVNRTLKKGDTIDVMPPIGHFYTKVNPAQKKNYVAFAAGSGITPVISIIKTVLSVEKESTFTLFYGNKGAHSIIFREELEGLKNKYIDRFSLYHILSREPSDIPVLCGRMNGEKCLDFFKYFVDRDITDEYFICGPGDMIMDIKETLEKTGIAKEKIHFELFTTPGENSFHAVRKEIVKQFDGKESRVTVILDGQHTAFMLDTAGDNILDAALKEGADVPYACKGAVCCTCKAKVAEGKVEMELNYSLTDEEVAAGYVLTCQSHPVSEKVVIDFDH